MKNLIDYKSICLLNIFFIINHLFKKTEIINHKNVWNQFSYNFVLYEIYLFFDIWY